MKIKYKIAEAMLEGYTGNVPCNYCGGKCTYTILKNCECHCGANLHLLKKCTVCGNTRLIHRTILVRGDITKDSTITHVQEISER